DRLEHSDRRPVTSGVAAGSLRRAAGEGSRGAPPRAGKICGGTRGLLGDAPERRAGVYLPILVPPRRAQDGVRWSPLAPVGLGWPSAAARGRETTARTCVANSRIVGDREVPE